MQAFNDAPLSVQKAQTALTTYACNSPRRSTKLRMKFCLFIYLLSYTINTIMTNYKVSTNTEHADNLRRNTAIYKTYNIYNSPRPYYTTDYYYYYYYY